MKYNKHTNIFIWIAGFIVLFPLVSSSVYSKGRREIQVGSDSKLRAKSQSLIANDPTVGSLLGKLQVSHTGALNYSIPISMPPGTAGIVPALTLQYNSQQKDGLLGMGFSLQGLTAITRTPQNFAQNGKIHGIDFTSEDRFALDGQQLVAVKGAYGEDGTEYRTYMDSAAKIVSIGNAGNGPASFKVWTKGGQIAEYAATSDSQLKAQVEKPDGTVIDAETAKMWALNKITDRAGNYLSVQYHNDQVEGSFYPIEIDYTGNAAANVAPYNSVKFTYENRPDIETKYHAGSKNTLDKRLSEIQVYQGSTLVYDYHLTYEVSPNSGRSRLTTVEKCDGAGVCLAPTKLQWQTNDEGWEENTQYETNLPGFDDKSIYLDANLTGNGLSGIVKAYQDDHGTNTRYAWINTGSQFERNDKYAPPEPLHYDGYLDRGLFVDVHGSGLMEEVIGYEDDHGSNNKIQSYQNTGDGWIKDDNYNLPVHIFYTGHGQQATFADLTGNGLPDFTQSYQDDHGTRSSVVWLNTGNGWNASDNAPPQVIFYNGYLNRGEFIDLTGDGLSDEVIAYEDDHGSNNKKQSYINKGDSWVADDDYTIPCFMYYTGKGQRSTLADLNADGLPDAIEAYTGDDGSNVRNTWLNTGIGWLKSDTYSLPSPLFYEGYLKRGTLVDINGDGLADEIIAYEDDHGFNDKIQTYLNTGKGWQADNQYNAPDYLYYTGHGHITRFIDINGNGLPDIVRSFQGKRKVWLNKAKKLPDMLIGVTNGLGEKTSIDYEPLSGTYVNVYTKDNDAEYPNMDFIGPMYVVYQTASSNPINDPVTLNRLAQLETKVAVDSARSPYSTIPDDDSNQHLTTYHYSGAKMNHQGWHFLGFRQVTTTDNSTGISKTTTYSQNTDDHTRGSVLATETQTKDGTIIASSSTSWQTKVFGDGTVNNTYYAISPQKVIKNSFSLVGKSVSITTIETTTDDYGNATHIVTNKQDVNTKDVYTTDTQNSYAENEDNWILGNVTKTVVTKTAPQVPNIVRTSEFTYDANGFLTKTVSEPNDPRFTLTKAFLRDKFGNIVSTTTSGRDIATRTVKVTYDNLGRYVIAKTNALGQKVTQVIDPKFGKAIEKTDLNGLVTKNKYDGFGRLLQITNPNKTTTNVSYQWGSGVIPVTGAVYTKTVAKTGSPTVTIYYDALNREIAKSKQGFNDNESIWQKSAYDELGRITQKSIPFYTGDTEYDSRMDYDVLGRLIKTTNPDNSTSKIVYDGLSTTLINQLHQKLIKIVDVRGKLVKTIDNLGSETNYKYDAYGNLTQTVDSAGNIASITYDKLGRKILSDDPDKGKTSYQYDQLGELLSKTDALGNKTTFNYDLLKRMVARTDLAGTSTWQYGNSKEKHNVGKLILVNGVANLSGKKVGALQLIQAAQDGLLNYTKFFTYNDLGLIYSTNTEINSLESVKKIKYDQYGRPQYKMAPDGLETEYLYNERGFLYQICNTKTKEIYWQLNAVDAQGHATITTNGNGIVTHKTYDPKTGFLTDITTSLSTAFQLQNKMLGVKNAKVTDDGTIQELHYQYDALGNVHHRNDKTNQAQETFQYDDLNRLTNWTENSDNSDVVTRDYSYDKLGNITYKSDIGTYTYSKVGVGPHAVTSVVSDDGETINQFKYDANGDQIEGSINGKKRTITYSSFNKPKTITTHDSHVQFFYNADRSRFERIDLVNGHKITTFYMGDYVLVCHEINGKLSFERKHYIGPNTLYVSTSKGDTHTFELLKDSLGSVTAITKQDGTVVQRFHYAPFGEQVDLSGKKSKVNFAPKSVKKAGAIIYPITHHGFTGHEEIEEVKLIHMNGRIYDPVLGRFLSADPNIQDPSNSQSLNRYSYCLNNPLAFTDPTGFFSLNNFFKHLGSFFHDLGHDLGQVYTNKYVVGTVSAVLACIPGVGWVADAAILAAYAASVVLVGGGDLDQAAESAAIAFATAVAFHYVGVADAAIDSEEEGVVLDVAEKTTLHGLVGGGIQAAEGGDFANGFLSSAAQEAGSCAYNFGKQWAETSMRRSAGSRVVGETKASTRGGNFANGSRTKIFKGLYHENAHGLPDWCQTTYAYRAQTKMSQGQYALCEMGLHRGESVALLVDELEDFAGDTLSDEVLDGNSNFHEVTKNYNFEHSWGNYVMEAVKATAEFSERIKGLLKSDREDDKYDNLGFSPT